MKHDHPAQMVLFTGGRDSTLVACTLMLHHIPVVLYTGNSHASFGRDLIHVRVKSLKERFGDLVIDHVIETTCGTFRSIAIENLEGDILKYKKNLVLLGEKLALHVHAIRYCLTHGIKIMNDGIVKYQQDLPEQKETARRFLKDFTAKYGIEYRSPIYNMDSEDKVKYKLLQLGLSTKSLEGTTLFADSFSEASEETVVKYLEEKQNIADRILQHILGALHPEYDHKNNPYSLIRESSKENLSSHHGTL